MSANNWRRCPRCKAKTEAHELAQLKEAQESYGKVSPAEYLRLVREATWRAEGEDDGQTLREDYTVSMNEEGDFHVGYFAKCGICKFEFRYVHDERVEVNP